MSTTPLPTIPTITREQMDNLKTVLEPYKIPTGSEPEAVPEALPEQKPEGTVVTTDENGRITSIGGLEVPDGVNLKIEQIVSSYITSNNPPTCSCGATDLRKLYGDVPIELAEKEVEEPDLKFDTLSVSTYCRCSELHNFKCIKRENEVTFVQTDNGENQTEVSRILGL